jgi:hypothetical protein
LNALVVSREMTIGSLGAVTDSLSQEITGYSERDSQHEECALVLQGGEARQGTRSFGCISCPLPIAVARSSMVFGVRELWGQTEVVTTLHDDWEDTWFNISLFRPNRSLVLLLGTILLV